MTTSIMRTNYLEMNGQRLSVDKWLHRYAEKVEDPNDRKMLHAIADELYERDAALPKAPVFQP